MKRSSFKIMSGLRFRPVSLFVLGFVLLIMLSECRLSKPKRLGKMPKRGAIPCPTKDC